MKIHAVLIACAVFLASSVASATVVMTSLTGGSETIAIGEQVTIGVTITNPDMDEVNGLGISVFGYDENLDEDSANDFVTFVSGEAVANYLNQVCVAPGSCFGGLENLVAGALSESAIGANGSRVQIGLSAGLSPVTNPGTGVDQGLDNNVGTAQFEIVFEGQANGEVTLTIGTGYQGDGIIIPGGDNVEAKSNATVVITVPEPGALAASAAALGSVIALAGIRRRS